MKETVRDIRKKFLFFNIMYIICEYYVLNNFTMVISLFFSFAPCLFLYFSVTLREAVCPARSPPGIGGAPSGDLSSLGEVPSDRQTVVETTRRVDLAKAKARSLHGSGRSRRIGDRRQGRGGGGVPFARLRVGGTQGGGGIWTCLLLPPLPFSRARREYHLAAAALVGGLEKLPPSPRVRKVLQGCISTRYASSLFYSHITALFDQD